MTDPELPPRIDPATIAAHRAAGWPDFHPEAFCHRCGEPNPSWWTPEWDAIRGDHYVTIVCPSCFCALHAVTTGERVPWRLVVDASEPGISPALLARVARAEGRVARAVRDLEAGIERRVAEARQAERDRCTAIVNALYAKCSVAEDTQAATVSWHWFAMRAAAGIESGEPA